MNETDRWCYDDWRIFWWHITQFYFHYFFDCFGYNNINNSTLYFKCIITLQHMFWICFELLFKPIIMCPFSFSIVHFFQNCSSNFFWNLLLSMAFLSKITYTNTINFYHIRVHNYLFENKTTKIMLERQQLSHTHSE